MWGAATEGWMMFAIIFVNLSRRHGIGGASSIISGAADARSQGRTLGAVSGLNSLMAVIAPMLAAPLLVMVSHLPQGRLAHRRAVLLLRPAAGGGAGWRLRISAANAASDGRAAPFDQAAPVEDTSGRARIFRSRLEINIPTPPMDLSSLSDGRESPAPAASAYVALASGAALDRPDPRPLASGASACRPADCAGRAQHRARRGGTRAYARRAADRQPAAPDPDRRARGRGRDRLRGAQRRAFFRAPACRAARRWRVSPRSRSAKAVGHSRRSSGTSAAAGAAFGGAVAAGPVSVFTSKMTGYHDLVEIRVAEGVFPGPSAVWFRLRYPLVAGEAKRAGARRGRRGLGQRHQRHPRLPPLHFREFGHHHQPAAPGAKANGSCIDARTLLGPDGGGLAGGAHFRRAGAGRPIDAKSGDSLARMNPAPAGAWQSIILVIDRGRRAKSSRMAARQTTKSRAARRQTTAQTTAPTATVAAVAPAVPAGYCVPRDAVALFAVMKQATAQPRKAPNNSRSASVPFASRCAKAQVFTPRTIGWCRRDLIALRGT